MKWYKVIVSYDGTDYFGWQVQKNLPTIAQAMQDTFYAVFKSRIVLRGASRTDAGVHALGHVAFFSTDLMCSARNMQFAWGNALPNSIVITDLYEVDPIVHPHAYVQSKTYWYHFFETQPLPFVDRYGWHITKKIDMKKLRAALELFVGTHDFSAFCARDVQGSTVRTIDSIEVQWVPEYTAWRIVITGKSFLRYMIRRIVAAALEVATNQDVPLAYISEMLVQKKQKREGLCAPAKGLFLQKIVYRDAQ